MHHPCTFSLPLVSCTADSLLPPHSSRAARACTTPARFPLDSSALLQTPLAASSGVLTRRTAPAGTTPLKEQSELLLLPSCKIYRVLCRVELCLKGLLASLPHRPRGAESYDTCFCHVYCNRNLGMSHLGCKSKQDGGPGKTEEHTLRPKALQPRPEDLGRLQGPYAGVLEPAVCARVAVLTRPRAHTCKDIGSHACVHGRESMICLAFMTMRWTMGKHDPAKLTSFSGSSFAVRLRMQARLTSAQDSCWGGGAQGTMQRWEASEQLPLQHRLGAAWMTSADTVLYLLTVNAVLDGW